MGRFNSGPSYSTSADRLSIGFIDLIKSISPFGRGFSLRPQERMPSAIGSGVNNQQPESTMFNLKSIFSCPEVLNTLTGLWADADTDRMFFEWLEEQCEKHCTDDFDQLAEMLIDGSKVDDNSDAIDVEAVVVQMNDDAVQHEQWQQRESDRRDYWEMQYGF